MRCKFASAVTDACKAMNVIPPDELKKYLRLGYPHLAPQIESMCTTDDMLVVVCGQCSLINLNLLKNVARRFNIEEAVAIIEEYKKNVDEFKTLRSFLDEELFSGSPLESETIKFIVDRNVDEYTLNDVELLMTHVFKELAPHVNIVVIKEHQSFIVTCSFPLSLTEKLIATAEENIELLKKERVKKLTIGYCTVFDSNDKVNIFSSVIDYKNYA